MACADNRADAVDRLLIFETMGPNVNISQIKSQYRVIVIEPTSEYAWWADMHHTTVLAQLNYHIKPRFGGFKLSLDLVSTHIRPRLFDSIEKVQPMPKLNASLIYTCVFLNHCYP